MSHTIPIQQASSHLDQLIRALRPDDEIVITDNDRPIARIVPSEVMEKRELLGSWKGKLEILDDSDDVILDHFRDYIP